MNNLNNQWHKTLLKAFREKKMILVKTSTKYQSLYPYLCLLEDKDYVNMMIQVKQSTYLRLLLQIQHLVLYISNFNSGIKMIFWGFLQFRSWHILKFIYLIYLPCNCGLFCPEYFNPASHWIDAHSLCFQSGNAGLYQVLCA